MKRSRRTAAPKLPRTTAGCLVLLVLPYNEPPPLSAPAPTPARAPSRGSASPPPLSVGRRRRGDGWKSCKVYDRPIIGGEPGTGAGAAAERDVSDSVYTCRSPPREKPAVDRSRGRPRTTGDVLVLRGSAGVRGCCGDFKCISLLISGRVPRSLLENVFGVSWLQVESVTPRVFLDIGVLARRGSVGCWIVL